MEGKGVRLIVAVMVAWVVIIPRPLSASANLLKVGCIGICMRECRMTGISIPACLKYCLVHCVPPLPPRRVFHCDLECLNQCVSNDNNSDEEKQDSCVSSCKNEKCNKSP